MMEYKGLSGTVYEIEEKKLAGGRRGKCVCHYWKR